jgi:proline dehydrogenase
MEKPTIKEVETWLMKLYTTSQASITPAERREQNMYATMVEKPSDKKFLVKMLDESSQIRDNRKLAKRIKTLIDEYGVPEFLSPRDRMLFKMYQSFGYHFYPIAIPIIKHRLRTDTSRVILDAARPALTKHLAERNHEDIGQNVNLLGEVVLGNEEADRRYQNTIEALKQPDINYISVKISGIYAQTHALNYEESFPELVRRMSELYQTAIDYPYVDEKGNKRPKFVNLDMEEYKDFDLTIRVFKATLSKPEFLHYSAGIVVQAYLYDAWDFQSDLLAFAKERCSRGGAPIKMRIVKGCNLDMETVTSSLHGWPTPVRPRKVEVDANYLHIIERGLLPENSKYLHIGMASHNLYTISYAYLLTQKYQTPKDTFCFEMLEGMADHVWRAQSQLGNHVILYAPVVHDEQFLYAVSYLVRRMDENTAPDNFLTHSFNLKPGTETWEFLRKQFEEAYALKDHLSHTPTRTQILRAKPRTPLSAETGGKNVIIITASADMDHGIMCACHSAFGNAGQKCSACSLLLVERSVYNRPDFREKLRDCATSLKVGGVWNAGNIVGPMITNHNEKLLKAIEKLEPGEEWLVRPHFVDKNHYILAPTVKLGVRPENYSFRTELFGPMLSVAPFDTLDEAINLVNGLDYGLTSGIQTLDENERRKWRDSIMAGNLYINRGITGAIVNRQPFGGMKLSAFGPGIKAGGPNYCQQFTVITDKPGSTTKYDISYRRAWVTEFSRPRDWNKCSGEQNVFRYLPLTGGMALRFFKGDTDEQAVMVATAAQICGTPLTVSFDASDKRPKLVERLQRLGASVKTESLDAFIESMPGYERIRTCSPDIPEAMYRRAAETNKFIATEVPVKDGRVELIHYLKEQSIAFEYHRYGSGQDKAPRIEEEYK